MSVKRFINSDCWLCANQGAVHGSLVPVLIENESFLASRVGDLCDEHKTEVSAELFKQDTWGHAVEFAAHLLRRDA